jgi:hypothetical protein
MIRISGSCISPSKGVEGVLYGGKLFMKKKLVSILLSLSMCAAYANPLATVAAEKAPAEDITVVETVSPNETINDSKFDFVDNSNNPGLEEKFNGEVEYDGVVNLRKKGWFGVKGSSSGAIGAAGKILDEGSNLDGKVSLSFADKASAKYGTINSSAGTFKGTTVGKTANIKIKITTGGGLAAEGTVAIQIKPRNIGDREDSEEYGYTYNSSGSAVVNFKTENNNKNYANLDTVVKKFKGKKGLTFKFDDKVIDKKYYTVKAVIDVPEDGESSQEYNTKKVIKTVGNKEYPEYIKNDVTGNNVEDRVDVYITGKKNYTGTFVVTGCKVENLETKRIVVADQDTDTVETISGKTIEFGGAATSLLDGITVDDGTAINKTNFVKAVKIKALTKNIKVNAKDGTVTVKKVGATDEENVAKVSIIDKKNKLAAAEIAFKVTAMSIQALSNPDEEDSDYIIKADKKKILGEKSKPKYYKSLEALIKKMGNNAKGLVLSYTQKVNGKNKVIKLKCGDNKDFTCTVTHPGVMLKKDGNDTGVYVKEDTRGIKHIVDAVTCEITGVGNYRGYRDDVILYLGEYKNLQIQLISQAGISNQTPKAMTYGSVAASIYPYILLDDEALNDGDPIKAAQAKDLKISAKTKNVKIDKDGKIQIKKVAEDGEKAEVTVTAKKNKGATATLEFILYKADFSGATVDKSALSGKTFKDESAAQSAIEKKLKATFGGKAVKNKDFSVTVSKIDSESSTTKFTADVTLTPDSGSSYKGTKTDKVSVSLKAPANTSTTS